MDLQIHKRNLGNIQISEVGLGTKGWAGCYGNVITPGQTAELIEFLQAHSCTLVDTSPSYGNESDPHYSETMLGSVIGPFRQNMVLATKFGLVEGKPDSSETAIRDSLAGSMKRLGTNRIDIYLQEAADPATPIEDVAATMAKLMDEDLIGAWGIVDADEQTIRAAHAVCPLAVIENRYSMLYRSTESLFGVLEELGIGLLAYAPLGQGFLTCSSDEDFEYTYEDDDIRSNMPLFSEDGFDANEGLLELVEGMAAWKYATMAHVALRWLLLQKPYIVPVFGTNSYKHADADICSVMLELSPTDLARMKGYLKDFAFADGFEPSLKN